VNGGDICGESKKSVRALPLELKFRPRLMCGSSTIGHAVTEPMTRAKLFIRVGLVIVLQKVGAVEI